MRLEVDSRAMSKSFNEDFSRLAAIAANSASFGSPAVRERGDPLSLSLVVRELRLECANAMCCRVAFAARVALQMARNLPRRANERMEQSSKSCQCPLQVQLLVACDFHQGSFATTQLYVSHSRRLVLSDRSAHIMRCQSVQGNCQQREQSASERQPIATCARIMS